MGGRTKVVKIAGRFGARYGSTLRKRYRDVMLKRYAPHKCPFCAVQGRVVRISVGLWRCRKCGRVFAGGAFVPRTDLNKYFPQIIVPED